MLNIIKKYKNWRDLSWGEIENQVFNLQTKIYKYAKRDNQSEMRHLQKELVRSEYAKLLAVRRVTQDNRGKKTAGIGWNFGITTQRQNSNGQ